MILLDTNIISERNTQSIMRFSGTIFKDSKFWLAEIPLLDLMTQGRTKKEAYEMVADMMETVVNKDDFKVTVYKGKKNTFEVGSSEPKHMVSLVILPKTVFKLKKTP